MSHLEKLYQVFMNKKRVYKESISLVLGGSAGQGLQTIEKVILQIFKKEGYCVFATEELMSRVRGGSNSVEIRLSSKKRSAFTRKIDIAFPLDKESCVRLSDRFDEDTIIITDTSFAEDCKKIQGTFFFLPFLETLNKSGGKMFLNTLVAGIILKIFKIKEEIFLEYLKKTFSRKGEDMITKNIETAKNGGELGKSLLKDIDIFFEIEKQVSSQTMILDGSRALALGSLAGGCNFISSYPMSPSTGVLNALAEYSQEIPLVVEQVEDEITAITMALGAWYAGARALVTTSGGGFALMAESMSLSGMTENPVVVHLAQRPGPSTGLPTRTEQGDLNFALHSGHGEFPRAIFAPGTPEECFECAKKAFDIADKYQVPVIIMTDQFLLESLFEVKKNIFDFSQKPQKYFIETDKNYKRYAFTDDGISPRGLPGFGEGFVHVDSDEHDEDGRIIEDAQTRVKMMEKRMYRLELLSEEVFPVVYQGNEDPSFLIVGWGSTYGVLDEVMEILSNSCLGYMHISQVFPLGQDVKYRIQKAKKVIVVENNMTGQFASLLHKECNRKPEYSIRSYDGSPFSIEYIKQELKKIID